MYYIFNFLNFVIILILILYNLIFVINIIHFLIIFVYSYFKFVNNLLLFNDCLFMFQLPYMYFRNSSDTYFMSYLNS